MAESSTRIQPLFSTKAPEEVKYQDCRLDVRLKIPVRSVYSIRERSDAREPKSET